ncbi:MAG: hypothetical protein NVSMB31_10490 [Vulcanimicrobiaceae bacterium]
MRVPVDLHAIATTACAAFAAATPLRIEKVVELAVKESQGARAPADKVQRSISSTLAGLYAGNFTVDVDGRTFASPDDVVVCAGCANVRFFLGSQAASGKRSDMFGSDL